MATKLQQYFIFKFTTKKLKKYNYDLQIDLNTARSNGEIVSLSDSQMLRTLRKLKNIENNSVQLKELNTLKKKIKKGLGSDSDLSLLEIEKQIDDILFVPEIISIIINDTRHYETIVENGLIINGEQFVRFLVSSGNARRNTAMFINKRYEKEMKKILNNGRNESVEINPGKFNAYFALCSSGSIEVSTPYFTVIKDCEVKRMETVDFISLNELDGDVTELEREITFNLFDGMGLVSPKQAKVWADEIGLDYVPSTFIVRGNFMKGMLAVVDFHLFSDEIGKHIIQDIYGNQVNVRDMDVILTQSQFKMWEGFTSLDEYKRNSKENSLGWGITRYAKREEDTYVYSNYQFLQVLDLDDDKIEQLCDYTVKYFEDILKLDINKMLIYLFGKATETDESDLSENFLNKMIDKVGSVLVLNNQLMNDQFIQRYVYRAINKKIKESYKGNLLLDGFYTMAVSDPFAFLEHMFGLPVNGLLKRGEHYNKTYLNRGINKVVAMRAPLTWRSEANRLELVNSLQIEKWYKYLDQSVIYNVHGVDTMLHADSDFDGDLICLINNDIIYNSVYGGNPVTYLNNKAKKGIIKEDELYKSDILSYNTKIGLITNLSTTAYSMLPLYSKDSKEYNELIKRLKYCRFLQGQEIDKVKGLIGRKLPEHWEKIKEINKLDVSDEVKKFYSSIIINKRPLFMRWLYDAYNRDFISNYKNFDVMSYQKFRQSIEDTLIDPNTAEKLDMVEQYNKYNNLLDSDCSMNKICHYMEKRIKLLKDININTNKEEAISLLKKDIPVDKNKYKKMFDLFKFYKSEKKNFDKIKADNELERFKIIEQFERYILEKAFEISDNIQELANLAVIICYEMFSSDNKQFVWRVFGEGIFKNVRENKQDKIYFPLLDEKGDIEYLGKKYSLKEIFMDDDDLTIEEYL